jgi:hypothetical protein
LESTAADKGWTIAGDLLHLMTSGSGKVEFPIMLLQAGSSNRPMQTPATFILSAKGKAALKNQFSGLCHDAQWLDDRILLCPKSE